MEVLASFSGTITPWLLGTLLLLSFIVLFAALRSWREMKRSPYFFQRLQAGKRLQTYFSTSLILFVISIGIGFYAWQEPVDATQRMAILANTKPVKEDIRELMSESPVVEPVPNLINVPQETSTDNLAQLINVTDTFTVTKPELPSAYNQFEATVDLSENTDLSPLTFSTEVSDDFKAENPQKIFSEGFYTIYATFAYEGMQDGMEWAWVWRHNGKVIDGGNELWAYGEDGPGYIFLGPDEGFSAGQYSLEVWVNEELLTASTIVVNGAAAAAGN
ncbi:MAG: hypothetical protein KDE48_25490 [Anaerolineales bacterium]|nr:hypothetical protein [Anaerolineales bacterium]